MSSKNGTKGIKLQALAEELGTDIEVLAPIAEKLGISSPNSDTPIPDAIATNIKIAKAKRDEMVKQLTEGSEVPEINRKLNKKEVKAIAHDLGVTQVSVRELDRALHNWECQIAALKGFQEQERLQQKQDAYSTGAIVAKLQELKQRGEALKKEESALIEEGLSNENSFHQIAKSMGVDVQKLIGEIEADTTNQATAFLNRAEGIQGLLEGEEMKGGEVDNPFVRLAYQRFRKQSS